MFVLLLFYDPQLSPDYSSDSSEFWNNANIMNKNNKWESAEETKVGWLEWFPIRDGNEIMLAPMCKGDGNDKCFASSNKSNVTTM